MREGGSYVKDKNGVPVLQERTGAVVTTEAEPEEETTSEVTDDENP